MTVLEILIGALRGATAYNRHDQAAPTVVLWTDGERLWEKSVPLLKEAMAELLVLDQSGVGGARGPSTWVRYRLAREQWRETPVVYLPGVTRQAFRSAVGFPEEAKHLFALQFQGQFWGQLNGKDWTPSAFLSSEEGGLGLDLARDKATLAALSEQLENILQASLDELRGKKLEADDFNRLGSGDSIRDLLKWISSSDAVMAEWKADRWKAFAAICKQTYGLDPEKDGVLTAVEKLVAGQGEWPQVWRRFGEAPKAFGGVRKALDLVQPKDLLDTGNERIPANNLRREEELRKGLLALAGQPRGKALEKLGALCGEHAARARSVWAEMGEAPLARAAVQLGELAAAVKSGLSGNDWQSLADGYLGGAWAADASAWKALACVREQQDLKAIGAALDAVYIPWIDEMARRVEKLAAAYPNAKPSSCMELKPGVGTVVVFVDGLRCDVGVELRGALELEGLVVEFATTWAALPTVTATAKPAWRPMAVQLAGETVAEGFEPQGAQNHKPLKTADFRALLEKVGWAWIDASSTGDPAGAGWTETGAFDRYGHEQGVKLAWRIDEELASVKQRVRELLAAGWGKVVVITDHGWLLAPGGLPKVDLPGHLTVSKWGRCALPQPGAKHGFREISWFWGAQHAVAMAPGISVFKAGMEYAHGGATIQEALTPVLTVTSKETPAAAVRIDAAKWVGLRLQVTLAGGGTGIALDVRGKPADPSSSLLSADQPLKAPDAAGKASLLVENETLEGQAAVLVVVNADHPERVLAQQHTIVGG